MRPILASLAALAVLGASHQAESDAVEFRRVVPQLELMEGIPPLPEVVRVKGTPLAVSDVFAGVNIDLYIDQRTDALPYAQSTSVAELSQRLRQRQHEPDERVFGFVVNTEATYNGDLGLMFAECHGGTGTRRGFAVFRGNHPSTLECPRDTEAMLTVVHELTHVFNLHHADGGHGSRTIENPATCASTIWGFSRAGVAHMTADDSGERWPGPRGWPFNVVSQEHRGRHLASTRIDTSCVHGAAGCAPCGAFP